MATPPRRPSLQRNAPLQTLAQASSIASPSSSNPSTTTSPTTTTSTTTLPTFTYTTSPSVSPTLSSTFSATTTIPALDNTNTPALTRSRYNSLPSLSPPALALSTPAVPTTTPRTSLAFGSGESWTLQPGSDNLGGGLSMEQFGMEQDMMMDVGMMTPRRGATAVGWAVDADGDALMMDVF